MCDLSYHKLKVNLERLFAQAPLLEDLFEAEMHSLSSAPTGFCGCNAFIDLNTSGEFRLTIKLGVEDEDKASNFDKNDFIDEILDGELEEKMDALFSDFGLCALEFEYLVEIYGID